MIRPPVDVEAMYEVMPGCGDGGVMGYFARAHVSKLALLRGLAWDGVEIVGRGLAVRQEWWHDVPASIADPSWEPCETGDEPTLFIECQPEAVGAYPVTVLYL